MGEAPSRERCARPCLSEEWGWNQGSEVEGEVLVGKAIAASLVSGTPLVVGVVTARTVFEEIRRQFLVEFSGLDPLSILEYFRVRLMPSVRERFMDRMPNFRQVSKE